MADASIRRAETEAEFEAARAVAREWPAWQLRAFPQLRDEILQKFEPAAYEKTLADLPLIHARPGGAVLLACLGETAVGCVMYARKEPGVAEFFRLFVTEEGRGHGLGRALLETMFAHMEADGYRRVFFTSARFLTHARALYESVGFRDVPAPPGLPDFVYAMERPLGGNVA